MGDSTPAERLLPIGMLLGILGEILDDGLLLVEDDTIHIATPRACHLLGSDALVGRRVSEVVDDYRILTALRAAASEGRRVERRLDDPRTESAMVVRVQPLSVHGAEAYLVVLHDETRLRRLEAVRRDFVANVSHELRTPIAAIQLIVDTLREGALADQAAATEFVARIGREVGHMAQMVEELLELSAIESGRRRPRIVTVHPEELLPAIDRLRPLADQRNLSLEVTVQPGTPSILGDAAQLGQVLRNLVHNAIKFTPTGGRIHVGLRPGPAESDGEPLVELTVADTGPGIAPGDLERIFERFWKSDRSRQRDGEGTGLGLAIVRHIVEAHGGRVEVESTPGRGATFHVFVPAAPALGLGLQQHSSSVPVGPPTATFPDPSLPVDESTSRS